MIKKLFIISLILLIPAFTYADDSIGGGNIHGENAPLAFQDATGDIVRPRTVITTYTDNGDGTITLAAGGGSGTPGGSDGDVQYNDGGSFGGFGDFNDGTNALTIPGSLTSGNIAATVANTINAIALDITQNDTTNNNKAALITNTGTGNALKIDQNGNTSVSTSVGGALLLDNTDNTGAGMIIYSDQGSGASGRLLNIRADNAAFDEAALHVDYDGVANAVEIVHNSSTEDSVALTVTENNANGSAVGITSNTKTHGSEKVIHTGTGDDTNASLWSGDIQGTGTACQGLYITSTTGGTTGKLLNIRNGAGPTEYMTLTYDGKLGLGEDEPAEVLDVNGNIKCSGHITTANSGSNLYDLAVGVNGAGGTEGIITLQDGANPGTTKTLSYTKWADLEAVNGIVKCNGSGDYSAAVDGTDYLAPTRIDDTKGNGDTAYTWSADKSFDQFALKGAIAGQVWTGVHDFGGADSLEVPNAASLTLDAAGEVGVNSTHKGFAWYDGTQEVFEPSIRTIQFNLGTAEYDTDPDVWSLDLDADTFPHGIYITKVYVDCNEADPTTELNADLKYCDAVGAGAFPGANAAVIKALDTTTGNMSDTAVNTAVSAGKTVYVTIDADPTSDTTLFHVKIQFYVPES